jgi:hypothetical protein
VLHRHGMSISEIAREMFARVAGFPAIKMLDGFDFASPPACRARRSMSSPAVGIMAAKRRGQKLGREPSLAVAQVKHARSLSEGGESLRSVAATFRVGRTTLWRALKAAA